MSNFKDLRVWIRAKNLAKNIYINTNHGDISKDFGLIDQMRRSAVSIASNITEGDESGTDKQGIRYFHISKGSSAELFTQLTIALEIGYLSNEIYLKLIDDCEAISGMLQKLINSRLR
jgi:four helix bundle protein